MQAKLQLWLMAWVDLAVALVTIITAANVQLSWDARVRWYAHKRRWVQDRNKKDDEDILGI